MTTLNPTTIDREEAGALQSRWDELRATSPRLRIRDAAEQLGVSEAQLVALRCGDGTTRLHGPFGDLFREIPSLGHVMALTRNESAVHEKRGVYRNVSVNGSMGLAVDEVIDLRVFFDHWHVGFAVREQMEGKTRRSLQFFDGTGTAVHKVFLESEDGVSAFEEIATRFASSDQSRTQRVVAPKAAATTRPDEAIDVAGFLGAWEALQDTHEFFGLLKKFDVGRTQALRLAEGRFTRSVPNDSLRNLLSEVAHSSLPIMVFVGSRGVIQIHTGPVSNVRPMGPWMNVLDREFNLHLREDQIASSWIVRKPTRDGVVTSLELFDAAGENIALLFGKRKPGIPENEEWRATVARLEVTHA